jgi:hypothetical protein
LIGISFIHFTNYTSFFLDSFRVTQPSTGNHYNIYNNIHDDAQRAKIRIGLPEREKNQGKWGIVLAAARLK